MAKQKAGYYELLEMIERKYPNKCFLKPGEAAEVLSCNIKTIKAAIARRFNPLPAKNVGRGERNKIYIIPVTELINWALAR